MKKIPVVLDTDIGSDMDDAWALALILKSPELDLKLILTETGWPEFRAAITAKYLEAAGRTDIPIGLGVPGEGTGPQAPWLAGYSLSDYSGVVHTDGIGALIDLAQHSPEPLTLICIGPVPNIPELLRRAPHIMKKLRIIGMFGSLRMGYNASPEICAETNVRVDPAACRQLFAAAGNLTITPLDTCGLVQLTGDSYQQIYQCTDPLIQTLIQSYISWAEYVDWTRVNPHLHSSTLFDTVAVYLALTEENLVMENLGVEVTSEGYTHLNDRANPVRCATRWVDLPAYEDWLVRRLTG